MVSISVIVAINYVNFAVKEGYMSHFGAFLFYIGLAFSMLSILSFNSLKGYMSIVLLTNLLMYWGYTVPMKAAYSFLGIIMIWTKILVVFLFVLFLVLAANQYSLWRQS